MKSDRCWVCLRITPEEVLRMAHRACEEDAKTAREIGLKASQIIKQTYEKNPTFFCGFGAKSALSGLFYVLLNGAGLRKTQKEVAQSLGIVECTVRNSFYRWKMIELEKTYGKSQKTTDVLGLGSWRLGQTIDFRDGKSRKLMHIEYRNMAVDLLTFDDGLRIFTEDIKDYFQF